jgi:hypothetical protein
MADVAIVAGEQLLIKIGDGGAPENFVHTCLINTARGVAFKTNLTTTEVADCADQSKPAKIVKKAKSTDFTITGAGKTDAGSVWAFLQWWQNGQTPKNIIIDQNLTGANGGFSGAGPAILSDFKLEGTRGDYQDFTCTIDAAAPFAWTQNA